MFCISMPVAFKMGDTVDVVINGEAKRLTWRDERTLVIEPHDVRTIFDAAYIGADLQMFICSGEVT